MNSSKPVTLDGSECPVCCGWDCTKENPHFAWILGTSQNLLVQSGKKVSK